MIDHVKENHPALIDELFPDLVSIGIVQGVLSNLLRDRSFFELEANDYRFLLRGKPVAQGRLLPNRSLAMNVSNSTVKIPGEKTKEPVFGLDAIWVDENGRKTAEMNGFTVVDSTSRGGSEGKKLR